VVSGENLALTLAELWPGEFDRIDDHDAVIAALRERAARTGAAEYAAERPRSI
jgi:hypothetical protein